jgi:hypothetical protein
MSATGTHVRPAAVLAVNPRPLARFAEVAGLALRLAPAPVGLACWANSMATVRINSIGSYGLLAAVDPWFFVGLGLLIVGFAAELARSHRQLWILLLYLVAIVVVIDATAPVLFHTPSYWWVYKHIGVSQSLNLNGRVTLPNEIYQEWPTFFSALAGFSSLSGVSALKFAAWAPLFFELSYCVVLFAIFRSMTRDPRVPILAVLLFECVVSWVGEDYLSPQAFAYLMWLGMMLLVVRWLSGWAPSKPAPRWLNWLRGPLLAGFEYRPAPRRGAYLAAVTAVLVLFFVVVSAHQLTPYMALAGLAGLVALGLLRPWWLLPMLAAIAVAFLVPREHIISSQYGGLFSGFDLFRNAGGRTTLTEPAALFSAHVATALSVVVWLWAIAVILRSIRRLGRVILPAVLAFAPFVILLFQSYGGEAAFRVFLFSAPWCAYLIATSILRLRWSPVRIAATALVPAAFVLASLQGFFGPIEVNTFAPAEVHASQWLYGHAPRGSTFVLAAENFPVEEAAAYSSYEVQVLPSDPELHSGEDWLDEGDIPEVDSFVAGMAGRQKFMVISRSQTRYSDYFGYPRGYKRLIAEIPSARQWTVVFRNPDVTIYRFAGASTATGGQRQSSLSLVH